MAFKTFAPGVLTSSDVNTFLMRQAVITCTSSTRPSSPSEGMTIYETDTDLFAHYTGSAWQYEAGYTTFTPTIDSASTGWSIGNGVASGRYARVGDYVFGSLKISFGTTSTFGASNLYIDCPVNSAHDFYEAVGVGGIGDNSTGTGWQILVYETSNNFSPNLFNLSGTWAQTETVTSTRPMAWNGTDADIIGFSFFYKAA